MASQGLYDDAALKHKLLRSLLREYVPDDRHPFTNYSELSYVVSTVKAHNLLSESAPQSLEGDPNQDWKSAVDSWVHRLLTLASSNSQDKCWAGICLLGVTCQECSPLRLLTSYAVWFDKLLMHIKAPAISPLVKAASCASLSDMFTRLSLFPNARKDGTSQATKIIEPVLKLLNEDNSDFVLEEAVNLLCTMINFFPFSVYRHYDSVEAAIASRLMSGKCCAGLSKKLACALSLLPKSQGDEASWSVMMEKILLCLNSQLNDAFQGIEEEIRTSEVVRALFSSGKDPLSPLGGLTASELSLDGSIRRPEQVLGFRISSLMQCCCEMLTVSYPVMVSVPVSALISVARRVLMIDGLLLSSSYSFMTIFKQEFICSEIPLLQSRSLDILAALVKRLSSQMLHHSPSIILLLNEYMSRCKFPNLRIKSYGVLKSLLMSMGVGIAIHISMDIVSNVFYDLSSEKDDGDSSNIQAEAQKNSHRRKRKHSITTQSYPEQPSHDGSGVDVRQRMTPLTLKIAALETLEVLLTVGGLTKSQTWRRKVDSLLISVAVHACKGPWSKEGTKNLACDDPTNRAEFKLATLRALHASLISPSQTRPSHLSQGLELFRRGLLERGTRIADYCGHALLNLEVLIHPRSLPVFDLDSSPQAHKAHDDPESEEDVLNLNWPEEDEMEIEGDDARPLREFTAIITGASVSKSPEEREIARSGGIAVENSGNISTVEEYPSKFNVNREAVTIHETEEAEDRECAQESVETEPMHDDDDGALKNEVNYSVAGEGTSEQDKYATGDANAASDLSRRKRSGDSVSGSDYDSDDSLPDIVDGDPDSD